MPDQPSRSNTFGWCLLQCQDTFVQIVHWPIYKVNMLTISDCDPSVCCSARTRSCRLFTDLFTRSICLQSQTVTPVFVAVPGHVRADCSLTYLQGQYAYNLRLTPVFVAVPGHVRAGCSLTYLQGQYAYNLRLWPRCLLQCQDTFVQIVHWPIYKVNMLTISDLEPGVCCSARTRSCRLFTDLFTRSICLQSQTVTPVFVAVPGYVCAGCSLTYLQGQYAYNLRPWPWCLLQCQDTFVQFVSFLNMQLSTDELARRLPPIDQLIQTYYLNIETSFSLSRSIYSNAINVSQPVMSLVYTLQCWRCNK